MVGYLNLWPEAIAKAEAQHGLPSGVLSALIAHESGWNPQAVGDGGRARGLCQMHAGAASDVGASWDKLFDPELAIEAGAEYLAQCLARFSGDLTWALAAYNQGSTVMERGRQYAKAVQGLMQGTGLGPSSNG